MTDLSLVTLQVLHGHRSTQERWSVLIDDDRYYRDERTALHRQIIKTLFKGSVKRNRPRALVMAGGPASGKSTLITKLAMPTKSVRLDADAIKELLPEYVELQQMGEIQAAFVVHEESSDIARAVLTEVLDRRRHLVLDTVGDSEPGKFVAKLADLHAAGYRVDLVYADVPTDVAVTRAAARARVVPEGIVRDKHRQVAARFGEVEALDWLTSLRVFATDSSEPHLIAERAADGSLIVHDAAKLESFRNKAKA